MIGLIFYKIFKKWTDQAEKGLRRHAIMAFVFCLLMAYVAEKFFGVADITGAFIAGLIISNTSKSDFVLKKFDTMSYMLLSPVFFASIGLKVELPKMSAAIVGFAVILTIVAILTKIVGCALGAKKCARIGVGMISRGEVALIVASKGEALGMMGGNFLGPVIIVVVITTIITPILLKIVFKSGPNVSTLEKGKEVTSFYEDIEKKRTE